MKHRKFLNALFLLVFCAAWSVPCLAQNAGLLKRTTTKTDRLEFGVGGTVAIVGAPNGSIRVEGWKQREIEIVAEIEIQAPTEADLAKIAAVTGFVLEESLGRTGIISVGMHDKKYMKKAAKKFPKALLKMPYRIDYVVRVPQYCDLQIDGGKGDLSVSMIEGTMRINYLDSNAKLDLVGGGITATFGTGKVDVTIPTRSWRGRFADIQLASGDMSVELPPSLNAEVDATILRTGKIDNSYAEFKPRARKGEFTDKSVVAKAGTGGIALKFTVGDGTLTIAGPEKPE